ncbi:hypothetical protein GPECTOR_68g388 [Gonium pectorale]|uniref:SET domain-containing protein n=1 Tax=Gonium pectorale TaxID=33097 RepID=A0A150G3G3_GONPE|nr:hypothetical protein GPECTOR_68g388 [Gonium pectorale]|eukprot:KXZ44416.1 hypothetical protein GPECTOR_68g388 [Gonium pectorale]
MQQAEPEARAQATGPPGACGGGQDDGGNNVVVQSHPRFGRCAFARRAFRAGEVVLLEAPLLITPHPPSSASSGAGGSSSVRAHHLPGPHHANTQQHRQQTLASQYGQYGRLFGMCCAAVAPLDDGEATLSNGSSPAAGSLRRRVRQFLTWWLAPEPVRQLVLADMHHRPGPGAGRELEGADEVAACEWAAGVIVGRLLQTGLLPGAAAAGRPSATHKAAVATATEMATVTEMSAGPAAAAARRGRQGSRPCGVAVAASVQAATAAAAQSAGTEAGREAASPLGGGGEEEGGPPCPGPAVQRRCLDVATVRDVLLVWGLNAHEVGDRDALFPRGSKLTHTCGRPNTRYAALGGRGAHVALRDIAPGELLTSSYLGWPELLMSTAARRRHLRNQFAFRCGCERCEAGGDDLRDLPCPACVPRDGRGLVPPAVALGAERPAGVLTFVAAAVTTAAADGGGSAHRVNSAATVHMAVGGVGCCAQRQGKEGGGSQKRAPYWRCSGCGGCLPNDEEALFGPHLVQRLAGGAAGGADHGAAGAATSLRLEGTGGVEATLCRAVWAFNDQLAGGSGGSSGGEGEVDAEVAAAAHRLLTSVARALGPDHFATNAMLLMHSGAPVQAATTHWD